jgi:hypothetical protein
LSVIRPLQGRGEEKRGGVRHSYPRSLENIGPGATHIGPRCGPGIASLRDEKAIGGQECPPSLEDHGQFRNKSPDKPGLRSGMKRMAVLLPGAKS